MVKVDAENQHTYKNVRIGKVKPEGLIEEVYRAPRRSSPIRS